MLLWFQRQTGIQVQPLAVRFPRAEGSLVTLTVTAPVTVISLIGAVPAISAEVGCRAPVLSLSRPTVSAILAALSVVGDDYVIEIANDVIEALSGSWMRGGN
jgi:hypothetical protein